MIKRIALLFCVLMISSNVFADDSGLALRLKIPVVVETNNEAALEWLYNMQEALRIEHNKKGQDYNNNIITKEEWIDWKETYFHPRKRAISYGIALKKTSLIKSNKYAVDLDKDFEAN